ncbi:MAG: hypothetical protein KDD61_09505 [Bdellovibrionales bacterium]|nr:hypothetical protein [Bdellovibrionales bacterium]
MPRDGILKGQLMKGFNALLVMALTPSPSFAGQVCKPYLTTTPPFLVTDADASQGTAEYDNFKSIESTERDVGRRSSATAIIPRRSIVRPLVDYEVLQNGGDQYLPVEVISTRHESEEIILRYSEWGKKHGLPTAKAGDVGYVYGGTAKASLQPLSEARKNSSVIAPGLTGHLTPDKKDMLFVVTTDDFQFYPFKSRKPESLKDKVLRVATQDGKYRTFKCYQPGEPENYVLDYVFEVMSEDLTTVNGELRIGGDCPILPELYPVAPDEYYALKQIADGTKDTKMRFKSMHDLRFWSGKGLVQLPGTIKLFNGTDAQYMYSEGPFGLVHYVGNKYPVPFGVKLGDSDKKLQRAIREAASDSFMNLESACTFLGAMKEFRTENPAAPLIQTGDAFWPVGDRHKGHSSGTCIDIRPFRKDGAMGALGEQVDGVPGEYDKEMTKTLIQSLQNAGATSVIFDRPTGLKGVRKLGGHRNHIHVCFDPNTNNSNQRAAMKNSCASL